MTTSPRPSTSGATIEVDGLTKRFGAHTALDSVSFAVHPGTVTGFLGPNGAGKSTCMRMICGLGRPTSGSATVLGRPFAELDNPGRRVGVLLDASAQHSGRSGREILTLGAKLMGLPQGRVEQMLTLVGLTDEESGRRVGKYSLGMRQRLGIAHALLGDPQVLILDEPANGLDPAGIRWMRELLRGFANEGGTVLLSSHLLHEIDMIADDVVVIGRGRIVAQGTKDELTRGVGAVVDTTGDEVFASALRRAGMQHHMTDGKFTVDAEPRAISELARSADVLLLELRPVDGDGLEQIFFRLTADDAREPVDGASSFATTAPSTNTHHMEASR